MLSETLRGRGIQAAGSFHSCRTPAPQRAYCFPDGPAIHDPLRVVPVGTRSSQPVGASRAFGFLIACTVGGNQSTSDANDQLRREKLGLESTIAAFTAKNGGCSRTSWPNPSGPVARTSRRSSRRRPRIAPGCDRLAERLRTGRPDQSRHRRNRVCPAPRWPGPLRPARRNAPRNRTGSSDDSRRHQERSGRGLDGAVLAR